eukprot:Gregarina_sp_Poly_1__9501@NODE_597_length_7261_cov_402_527940_g461_i0_p6_GENE_NODE_597_length_7261_cov_402_527940_g461_i0NODE_597_length_7261_cov_402_527940_g461_i0_p6_ORF_typecomplete_len139_score2_96Asp/PF00026_23/2_3e12TAXi_C/PF14541_6/0_018_NODE_597_length_7261_cov_402_527940_g461_i013111727
MPSYLLSLIRDVIKDQYSATLPMIDCSRKSVMPPISFVMKDIEGKDSKVQPICLMPGELVEFEMKPDDYIIPEEIEGRNCLFGMAPLDVPYPSGPLIVLGISFLQKYLSIFDYGKPTYNLVHFLIEKLAVAFATPAAS